MKLLLTSFFMLFIVAFGFVGCNKNVDTGIKNDAFSEQNVVNFEENNEEVELPILTDLPEIIVEKYKIKQAKSIPAVKLSATLTK